MTALKLARKQEYYEHVIWYFAPNIINIRHPVQERRKGIPCVLKSYGIDIPRDLPANDIWSVSLNTEKDGWIWQRRGSMR